MTSELRQLLESVPSAAVSSKDELVQFRAQQCGTFLHTSVGRDVWARTQKHTHGRTAAVTTPRLPSAQSCVAATCSGRGVSVAFEPENGDYVAFATNSGLQCFATNTILEAGHVIRQSQQPHRHRSGGAAAALNSVDVSSKVRPHTSLSDATVDIGWSMLDLTWMRGCSDAPTAVASCWAPTLVVHRMDARHEEIIDLSESDNAHGHPFCCFGVAAMDARKVACGTNMSRIFVHDITAERAVWTSDFVLTDVNSVCRVQGDSVFAAGADTGVVYLCDTRQPPTPRCASQTMLLGHTNGILSIATRGDDITLVTSGKDQAVKVWDLRRATVARSPWEANVALAGTIGALSRWDYRSGPHTGPPPRRITAYDTSLLSFYGHQAFATLCRVTFSPLRSTAGRFVCSGSYSNEFVIYDLLAESQRGGASAAAAAGAGGGGGGGENEGECAAVHVPGDHQHVVRDVSWHPWEPIIATACWDGSLRFFEPPAL